MQEHQLYKVALDAYANDKLKTVRVLELYGDHLSSDSKYDDAYMCYSRCGKFDKALAVCSRD